MGLTEEAGPGQAPPVAGRSYTEGADLVQPKGLVEDLLGQVFQSGLRTWLEGGLAASGFEFLAGGSRRLARGVFGRRSSGALDLTGLATPLVLLRRASSVRLGEVEVLGGVRAAFIASCFLRTARALRMPSS